MNGTTLSYNGITFHGVTTLGFSQCCRYTDDGTDLLLHEFDITVRGMVHAAAAAPQFVEAPGGTSSAASIWRSIESTLMHPRGRLEYRIGAEPLLVVDAAADVDSGPKPQSVKITHVAGTRVLRVEFRITVAAVFCAGSSSASPAGTQPVLTNRWTLEDSRDQNFYTTRAIRGKLRVSHFVYNPQYFRHLCIPPLEEGFRRQTITFATAPDGLEMNYEIVDRQIYAAPPAPATDWECRHTVATPDGRLTQEEISLVLIGSPEVDKRALLVLAARIAEERTGHFRTATAANPFLRDVAVIDHVHDSRVEMRLRVQHKTEAQNVAAIGSDRIGAVPSLAGYDPLRSPHPERNYGPDTPTGAFLMRWQTPCEPDHGIPGAPPAIDHTAPQYQPATRTLSSPTALGAFPPNISASHKAFPYLLASMTVRYDQNEHKAALPIAGSSGSRTQAIVTLARATATRIVEFSAERAGAEPELPAPSSAGAGETLLTRQITPSAPELMPDGVTLLYRAACRYTYALDRPPSLAEGYKAGSLPWDGTVPEGNRLSGGAFVTGIDE